MPTPPQRLDAGILVNPTPGELVAKDSKGGSVVFEPRKPDPIPEWARQLVDAYNELVDAVRELQETKDRDLKTLHFTTKDLVEDTFPLFVSLPRKPAGLHSIRTRNLDDSHAIHYDPPAVDFTLVPEGVVVRFISGLNPNTRYATTVEVIYE